MNTIEMKRFANEWLLDNYNLTLDIPIEINNRLSRSLGRFMVQVNRLTGEHKAIKIDMNGKFVRHNKRDEILMTLKHELVHYAMFTLGKPYRDGDYAFEKELKRLNLTSNHYMNIERNIVTPRHRYECVECGQKIARNRRINVSYKQYVCGCGGDLDYKGHN